MTGLVLVDYVDGFRFMKESVTGGSAVFNEGNIYILV